jgi:hypothetical protein
MTSLRHLAAAANEEFDSEMIVACGFGKAQAGDFLPQKKKTSTSAVCKVSSSVF